MKDKLLEKILIKFVGLDDCSEDRKSKGTKKCVIKRKMKFENYKNGLEARTK